MRLAFIFLFYTVASVAQLKDCSQCKKTAYSSTDIENLQLFELQLLRNEIFARHGYIFKNDRLSEFYSQFDWYLPKKSSKVKLNKNEKHNVELFLSKEKSIRNYQNQIIISLSELKVAAQQNDIPFLNSFFRSYTDQYSIKELTKVLKDFLFLINPDDIHWHKGNGYYKVNIDNGFHQITTQLTIESNHIRLSKGVRSNSEIIEKPFEYPSTYFSENEFMNLWVLKFKNGLLILDNIDSAG